MMRRSGKTGGLLRGAWRLAALGTVIFGALAVKLALRALEAPICGPSRPISAGLTQLVCRAALRIMGLRLTQSGQAMANRAGLVVANHASWLDIFALNAAQRLYFVSKSEVAGWAGIGWLARATGTLFIARKSTQSKRQQTALAQRLTMGHRLVFFPEGTSTDSTHILPFKPTLFAAAFSQGVGDIWVQPASVIYTAPKGQARSFYGWYGDMEFAPHLWAVAKAHPQGKVHIIWHPPLRAADFANRKDLAQACEAAVRAGFERAYLQKLG